jgi:hypothetical protein
MSFVRRTLVACALTPVVALVAPLAANAHPGVYQVTAKVAPQGCTYPTAGCLTDQTQYTVANDGWVLGFVENNNRPLGAAADPAQTQGIINYKVMPGAWRGNATTMSSEQKRTLADAQTDLQPHATCVVATLDTPANVLAWQGADPFFNYVPWQAKSAGLGDDPGKWIPVVKSATGVDLTSMSDAQAEAACESAPVSGTYYPADASSAIANETVKAATDPLQSQITQLQTGISSLQTAKGAVEAQLVAARNAPPAVPARPLTLTLAAKRFNPAVAMVTGAAGSKLTVKMTISANDAKRRRISRTVSTRNVTLGSTGAALVNLGLTSKAKKALRKRSIAVTVDATGTGGTKTAGGVYVG